MYIVVSLEVVVYLWTGTTSRSGGAVGLIMGEIITASSYGESACMHNHAWSLSRLNAWASYIQVLHLSLRVIKTYFSWFVVY